MAIRVLVVDDASFVRDLVKRTMRTHFPAVKLEEAINGRKAQILMSKGVYDMVLCDWEMPEMSGIELLEWARANEHYRKIPFIMVTSRGDRSHVVEAVQQGASDYLTKPFSPEMLLHKINKHLGKKVKQATKVKAPGDGTDSVSVLTGAAMAPKPTDKAPTITPASLTDSASILTGKDPAPAKKAAPSTKTLAQIRFADFNLPCIIKAINLSEIKVVAKREQKFPAILEPAVVDLEIDDSGKIERINGYVHSLQAVDKRMDTDFVSVVVRFVDDDPDKMASLSKYIAKF